MDAHGQEKCARPHMAFEVRNATASRLDLSIPQSGIQLATAHPAHFFTVDVEEYFQVNALESAVSYADWPLHESRVAGSVDKLLKLLRSHEARATFFVLGWIADRQPEVVRMIAAEGHEIASHGFRHQKVTSLDRESFAS